MIFHGINDAFGFLLAPVLPTSLARQVLSRDYEHSLPAGSGFLVAGAAAVGLATAGGDHGGEVASVAEEAGWRYAATSSRRAEWPPTSVSGR